MSLKQDIVVVNEYSVPLSDGQGSRGGTPGAYVTRYMARESAVESLAPIQRLRTDDFIMRYMARESAVERAGVSKLEAKTAMRQAQGDGGVAFGYGSVSLSDAQLKAASRDIQSGFDSGKTVLKTVLSFSEEYLRRHRIVDEDFHCEARGDYRGHIDQMKLRMAIMHGLDRMGTAFDDLRYVAVIQVDTEHVHCHLAMLDAGAGTVMPDGTQRGKLLDKHLSRLRRGVDAHLDQLQQVAHLSSAVGYERRNVTSFVKRWAHEQIRTESLPQFLLACLPADRSLWRVGTHSAVMRKANTLVGELVAEQLSRPGSPMPAAMERIVAYADHRRESEGLDPAAWQQLIDSGREQLMERAVNGVYQLLRSLPANELTVRTPMLQVMGMDYQQLALLASRQSQVTPAEDDLVSFGFRLRSYGSRLAHHQQRVNAYRDLVRRWEQAHTAGVASDDSRSLYDFYIFEQEYHRQLVSKYQHFLPFTGDTSAWFSRQQEVTEYGQRLLSLTALRGDTSLQRMRDGDQAEAMGRQVYDQPGGRYLTEGAAGRAVLDARLHTMRTSYADQVQRLREDLGNEGLVLQARFDEGSSAGSSSSVAHDVIQPGTATRVQRGVAHEFEQVKALDLHHLGYDFITDVEIGRHASDAFTTATRRRRELLLFAMRYLDASGQSLVIDDLPVDDVAAMTRTAEQLTKPSEPGGNLLLPSKIAALRERATDEADAVSPLRSKTSSLDAGLAVRVQARVDEAVSDTPDAVPDRALIDPALQRD